MKHSFFLFILSILIFGVNAQSFISGTVVDKTTNSPVYLVAVGINSKGTGTNTNADGKFQLLITESNKCDTIRFSIIGYDAHEMLVSELQTNDNIIKLSTKIFSLDEVTIRSKKLSADDVIKDVIKNREKNYNFNPFKLEAYYREIRNVNKKYDHLIEAALNTYGKGIDKYFQKVELLNSRKIDHVRFEHDENLLNSTLRLDYIANNDGFIKLADFKNNKYKFEDIRIEGGNNIYVISSGTFPDRKYTFYINEEDHAIVRLEMEDWYAERGKLYLGPIDKTHVFRLRHFKVINIYKSFLQKYYPDYISVLWDYDKYNSTTKSVYENSSWLREFRVNQIVTQDIPQPDPSKLMSKSGGKIDDQMTAYDAEFWRNYNLVPLTSNEIADLESKGALEEQFIKNGTQVKKRKNFKCDNKNTGPDKVICLLQNYHDLYEIPGAQFAVSVNGKLVISEAFGYADVETKTKATTQTPFRIASVSKPIAALCALKLKEDGLLDLDLSVQTYVPSFPEKKWPITTRQLLNNTSGIRQYWSDEKYDKKYQSMTEATEIFHNDSLLFQPDKSSLYSSFGYNLLGAVIEGASKTDYMSYLNTAILAPLQMTSTFAERTPKESSYYLTEDGQRKKAPTENLSYAWSSEGLASTAEDLIKFGNGLLNSTILKKEGFQLFRLFSNPQIVFENEGSGFSLGWFIDTDPDGNVMIHHSGATKTYCAHLLIYPDKGIVIAYLANTGSDTFFDKDLADEIVRTILKTEGKTGK